jgi:hypothetical protein
MNAILVIHFITIETTSGVLFHSNVSPAIGLAVLFIPVIDTIRVMVLRIYKGKSPFVGDRNHIHHLLLRKGYSHMKVTFMLSLCNAFIIFYSIIFRSLGITFLVFSMTLIFFAVLQLFLSNSAINEFSEDPARDLTQSELLSDKIITTKGEIEASQK